MNQVAIGFATIALVKLLRQVAPKVDGTIVHAATIGIGAALFGLDMTFGANPIWQSILVSLAAAGGMTAVSYHADKSRPDAPININTLDVTSPTLRPAARGFVELRALVPLAAIAMFAMIPMCVSCLAAKPGCAVIKIADYACDTFTLELPDGGTIQVSRAELMAAGERTKAAAARIEAGACDGGCKDTGAQ